MRVAKLTIIATSGANKRPTFGQVTFADGRTYFWSRDVVGDGVVFSSSRRFFAGTPSAYSQSFSFFSPKRAAAVETYLAGNGEYQMHLEGAAVTVEPVGYTISVVWDGKRAIGTHQVWWVRENYRGDSGQSLSAREAAEEHIAFLLVSRPDWQAELVSLVAT